MKTEECMECGFDHKRESKLASKAHGKVAPKVKDKFSGRQRFNYRDQDVDFDVEEAI